IITIPKGKTIEIVDKSNSNWYKVKYDGKIGYVSSEYVSINGNSNNTNKPSTTSEKGVTTANLNLREGASTSSKIIITIPKGKTIEIVDKSNSSWYKVKYSGKIGYVSSKYVRL
ncbi:SH3 domain-containing protein, partial [Romboutsia ilealis]|uniref:SH3 domain-containing protein n=1 Tax=Romboutsia ilealis TaxID=1115758 RepID=UPI0025A4EEDB